MKRLFANIFMIQFFLVYCFQDLKVQVRFIKDMPLLCYHNITFSAKGHCPGFTCSISAFERQLKGLFDNGFHSRESICVLADEGHIIEAQGDWSPDKLIKRIKNISQTSVNDLRMVIDLNNSPKM